MNLKTKSVLFWNSNHCATSIIDLHRCCPNCSYELCLSCCQEIREGRLSSRAEVRFQYVNRGPDYIHGGDPFPEHIFPVENHTKPFIQWNASNNSIQCAPKELGGCGDCKLELKRILPKWFQELELKMDLLGSTVPRRDLECSCAKSNTEVLRRAASREGSDGNYLYCPTSNSTLKEDELDHFQVHWAKGEPVIVRNVLESAAGLSWEPMVMWRALCENWDHKISSKMAVVKAIDCLACCEVGFYFLICN